MNYVSPIVELVMLAVSSFAVAWLVTKEDGPGIPWRPKSRGVFFNFRLWAGVYDRGQNGMPETQTGRLWSCPICASFYILCVFYAVQHFVDSAVVDTIMNFLFCYGVVILLSKLSSNK